MGKGIHATSNATKAMMTERQTLVARYILRGMTLQETTDTLAVGGHVNPDTDNKWSLATISKDIHKVRRAWQLQATRDYSDHIARSLAEIRELRRYGWEKKDTRLILKCWDREVKLLGLNAPEIMQIVDWRREAVEVGIDVGDLFDRMVGAATKLIEDSSGPVVEGSFTRS